MTGKTVSVHYSSIELMLESIYTDLARANEYRRQRANCEEQDCEEADNCRERFAPEVKAWDIALNELAIAMGSISEATGRPLDVSLFAPVPVTEEAMDHYRDECATVFDRLYCPEAFDEHSLPRDLPAEDLS